MPCWQSMAKAWSDIQHGKSQSNYKSASSVSTNFGPLSVCQPTKNYLPRNMMPGQNDLWHVLNYNTNQ